MDRNFMTNRFRLIAVVRNRLTEKIGLYFKGEDIRNL
jgi:hypothetical protein